MNSIKLYLIFLVLAICFNAEAQSEISENYTYDNAGRLISVEYGNGTSISYSYDPAGNLLSLVSKGIESSTSNENLKLINFSIVPNPASNIVKVKFGLDVSSEINVFLYNALGELEHTFYRGYLIQGDHEFSLATESYPPGLYYCRIESEDFKLNRKVVVIH